MKTTHGFQIGLCSFTVCVKIRFPVLEMQLIQIFCDYGSMELSRCPFSCQ